MCEVGNHFENAAPAFADRPGDPDHFIGSGREARCELAILGAMIPGPGAGESDRAGGDGLPRQTSHGFDLERRRAGRMIGATLAHHEGAECAMGNLGDDVDCMGILVDRVHVLGEALPFPAYALGQCGAGDVLDAFHQTDEPVVLGCLGWRKANAAIAHHDRRHPVPDRRREVGIPCHLAIVVSVNIDPSRCDEEAICIDLPFGGLITRADAGDDAIADSQIGLKAGRPGPVDDRAASDPQIEHVELLLCHRFATLRQRGPRIRLVAGSNQLFYPCPLRTQRSVQGDRP